MASSAGLPLAYVAGELMTRFLRSSGHFNTGTIARTGCVGQTLSVELRVKPPSGRTCSADSASLGRNPTETERTFSPRVDRRFFLTLEAIHLAYEHEYREATIKKSKNALKNTP